MCCHTDPWQVLYGNEINVYVKLFTAKKIKKKLKNLKKIFFYAVIEWIMKICSSLCLQVVIEWIEQDLGLSAFSAKMWN